MVRVSACHAEDPGSIPCGRVGIALLLLTQLPGIGAQLLLHIFQEGAPKFEPEPCWSAVSGSNRRTSYLGATVSFHQASTATIHAFISFLCLRRRLSSMSEQLPARMAIMDNMPCWGGGCGSESCLENFISDDCSTAVASAPYYDVYQLCLRLAYVLFLPPDQALTTPRGLTGKWRGLTGTWRGNKNGSRRCYSCYTLLLLVPTRGFEAWRAMNPKLRRACRFVGEGVEKWSTLLDADVGWSRVVHPMWL